MTDVVTGERTFVWREPSAAPRGGERSRRTQQYVARALILDAAAAALAAVFAQVVAHETSTRIAIGASVVSYRFLAVVFVAMWLLALAIGGSYDERVLGNGSDEYRRVLDATLRLLAVVAVISFAARLGVARDFVAALLPSAFVLTFVGRHRLRKWVHGQRAKGRYTSSVVVVGSLEHATDLVRHLQRSPFAGFSVFGVCVPGAADQLRVDGATFPVLGTPADAERIVQRMHADCVAIADVACLPSGALRRIAWSLEGSGVDLIVVPALTDVAGPRIATRPVAGLPLLHVEEPVFSGAGRVFKETYERIAAGVAIILLLPFLLMVAMTVRATSHGPAFYRQTRVGKHGEHFVIWKFRTMRNRADEERLELEHLNEHQGPLFKIRADPRLTPVGRWLRRFSIDELPQLLHVVSGKMSLVGPRPPLPSEVAQYDLPTSRRLLVKPGLTGLWQVSGRSDLAWDESVRLDLYYVENWSPALDFVILWKTLAAVMAGRGAY
ncbi:MAG TPA: sugar transferase [Acidimicrobiales bacterium]|nr:sugar transferase [Acidimicrobiales bacterium]